MKYLSRYVYPQMFYQLFFISCLLVSCTQVQSQQTSGLAEEANARITELETLMEQAKKQSIDINREEALLWFSKEFLKFADWDEANKPAIEKLFGYYGPYKEKKAEYAAELPDLERRKVKEMLEKGIAELKKVLDGSIQRPPVAKIDWENIEVKDGLLWSKGKPVFLFDYFSKSVGIPLTDTSVYNDYLGNIYHGGSRLYEVDQDRAINPFILNEDGSFDLEKLELLEEIPDTKTGFLLYWNSGMPQWVLDREPQVAKGRSLFTGFDVDNPLVRDVWSKVIRKTGEMTRDKKVTQLGYILSNEPHWFAEKDHWTQRYKEMNSISSYTLEKFRKWLAEHYGGRIQVLNKNWKSDFSTFDEVELEIPMDKAKQGTPVWYDWNRFNMYRGIDWFTFIQKELHAVNPDADTHIKIMPNLFTMDSRSHGIDLEALTELTTMIGNDAKTTEGRALNRKQPESWEEKYSYHWDELAVSYDFFESVAPNKVNINSETHFLSTSQWRDLHTSPEYVRSCFWLATLHGMDAGISWFWARDPDGSPEDRLEGELDFFDPALAGSYAGSANMQPQMVNEVAQVMMDMNSVSEEMIALRNQRRPIRIFYSETSAINKAHYMTEQFDLYESLYFEGFPLGYATEKILGKRPKNEWDVIVVYKSDYVTDSEFEALQAYLKEGGTVILDAKTSLSKNEYGKIRKQPLLASSGKLIRMEKGASVEDVKREALQAISGQGLDLKLKEANGTPYKGCTWRVAKQAGGGYVMTILNVGKNTAVLELHSDNGKIAACTNMLTGQQMGVTFELAPKGVLLLEVQ